MHMQLKKVIWIWSRHSIFWPYPDEKNAGNKVVIGDGTTAGGVRIICSEGTKISIGSDCMLSSGIEIRSTDSHPMFDLSGARINPACDILIGDHVWIAAHAVILKGSIIGARSTVRTCAVVTGKFDEGYQAIAGNPARGAQWCHMGARTYGVIRGLLTHPYRFRGQRL